MVRLRTIGSEFHTPDDFRQGAPLYMPYLEDMRVYQRYMDGDITPLFERFLGNATQQNVTGSRFYTEAGSGAYWQLNLFQAVMRFSTATIWEQSPTVLTDDEAVQEEWETLKRPIIREARKATDWKPAKGRGVLALEQRFPGVPVFQAVDPAGYIPIVDRVNRDLQLGHALLNFWYEGQRLVNSQLYNRVTVQIYVDEEGAELSDGRIPGPVNQVRTYHYATNEAFRGTIGSEISRADNSRLLGVWSFGDDDSLFKSMERNVYEIILLFTHARTAITRDVRSLRIDPRVQDQRLLDDSGNVILSLLDPHMQVDVNSPGGNSEAIGYVEPPGPMMSQAFMQLADTGLEHLAYVANTPRESFGLNFLPNEPAEAVTKLQQIFRTMVMDTRDDLSKIMSEAYRLKTGREVDIGWEHEPFADSTAADARAIALYSAGLASQETAQKIAGLPVEEVEAPNGNILGAGNPESNDFDGRGDDEPEGTED